MKEKRYFTVAGSVFSVVSDGIMDGLSNYVPFEGKGNGPLAFNMCVEPFEETMVLRTDHGVPIVWT